MSLLLSSWEFFRLVPCAADHGLFFFSPPSFWPGKNILPRKSSCRTLLAGKLSRSLLAGRIEQIYFPSSSLTALSLYIPLSVCCLAGFSSRQDGEFRQVFILEGWKLQKVHCSDTPPPTAFPSRELLFLSRRL